MSNAFSLRDASSWCGANTYANSWTFVGYGCDLEVLLHYTRVSIYLGFILKGGQMSSKTYMTRVAGKNTRVRHYLAWSHRKTLCYLKAKEMLRHSIRLLLHCFDFWDVSVPCWFTFLLCNARSSKYHQVLLPGFRLGRTQPRAKARLSSASFTSLSAVMYQAFLGTQWRSLDWF